MILYLYIHTEESRCIYILNHCMYINPNDFVCILNQNDFCMHIYIQRRVVVYTY